MKLLKDESLVASWTSFFEEKYKSELETIALESPEKRSIFVDYWDIDKFDPGLTDILINQPYKAVFNAEAALSAIDVAAVPPGQKMRLHFRVINLPEVARMPIREKSSQHLGSLISVEGLIRRRTSIFSKLQVAAFQCGKCGAVIRIEQDEDILKEPSECYEDQGGCGRVSSFKLSVNLSTFIDSQKIEIQENPEELTGASQPEKITIYLEDDLTSLEDLNPGDRITVNGIFHSSQKRKGRHRLTTFDFCLEAVSYEVKETAFEDIKISEEDKKKITNASKDPLIYRKLQQSIAPSIFGRDVEKDAIVLQLFGGERKTLPDGTIVRGDIHILITGDPGTAKSQLILFASKLAPRSIFTAGPSSTGAGLTATAVKDEFSEGQWVLEAGTLVLADQGLACIDELDKMDDHDRDKIHQAMEQQEISIAKAGINTTLKSRCSILAAANPKLGRFDQFTPIHGQINLPSTLFSRFDLIFTVIDKPNKEVDADIAEHILRNQQTIKPPFSPEFLRKYIAYAKQCTPIKTDEMIDRLKEYYIEFRSASQDNSVPVTARQLESLVRLATASARIRLSDKITLDDAERAIQIFDEYVKGVCLDPETGKVDYDIIATGQSYSQHQRMNDIIDIIRTQSESDEDGANKFDIIREAEIIGIDSEKTESSLDKLKTEGIIFEPKHGYFKLMRG